MNFCYQSNGSWKYNNYNNNSHKKNNFYKEEENNKTNNFIDSSEILDEPLNHLRNLQENISQKNKSYINFKINYDKDILIYYNKQIYLLKYYM